MGVKIYPLTILWAFLSIFADHSFQNSHDGGCYLSESSSSSSLTDADLVCRKTTLNKENGFKINKADLRDTEVVALMDVQVDLERDLLENVNVKSLLILTSTINVFEPECSRLQNLEIHYSSFPRGANFDDCCPNLLKLKLRNNTGLALENSVFTKLNRLHQMRLSHMSIRHLKRDMFRGLKSLKKLRISDMNFEKSDPDAFGEFGKLTELSLEENQIEDIDENIFKPLNKLRVLTVYAKNLRPLSMEMFRGLSNLREVGLPLNTWRSFNLTEIPRVFPRLASYSYTEEWEKKDDKIYKPIFRKLNEILSRAH